MFSTALEETNRFTLPVIYTQRFRKGNLSSGLGTFVVVNRDGWMVTADHIVADIVKFSDSQTAIQNYEAEKKIIEDDDGLKGNEKRRRIQRLHVSDDWVTHQAVMWGRENWTVSKFFRDSLADIAIGQIDGFDPTQVLAYPTLKNPSVDYKTGTSLCRLGYPFHEIKATFNDADGTFCLDPATFPVPLFPNDGILTRFVVMDASDHSRQAKFIETSTAGLRGQSGGPIFDTKGHVYAIQSKTISLPLGFAPTVKQGTRDVVEHQFIHLGWGSHISNVVDLFRTNGVSFSMEPIK